MATKKRRRKKRPRKRTRKGRNLVDDPPIIVGGGGSTLIAETLISLPKGTPKTGTIGDYDVYQVAYDVRTIITKHKKNGDLNERASPKTTHGSHCIFEDRHLTAPVR